MTMTLLELIKMSDAEEKLEAHPQAAIVQATNTWEMRMREKMEKSNTIVTILGKIRLHTLHYSSICNSF